MRNTSPLSLIGILVFLFLSIFIPGINAESNLVINPGFEAGLNSWNEGTINHPDPLTTITVDKNEKHSGIKSLCIFNNTPNGIRYMQEIHVKPNVTYQFSGWIKVEKVGDANKGAYLVINNQTSKGLKGTNGKWEQVQLKLNTPQSIDTILIGVGIGDYGSLNTGKAWFDDITFEEITPNTVNSINNSVPPSNNLQNQENQNQVKPKFNIVFILLILFFIAVILYFIFIPQKITEPQPESSPSTQAERKSPLLSGKNKNYPHAKLSKSSNKSESAVFTPPVIPNKKIDRTDLLIMIIMTVIYLVIALYNLGSLKVPITSWAPVKSGEYFIADLGKEIKLSRVNLYFGSGIAQCQLAIKAPSGNWVPILDFNEGPKDNTKYYFKGGCALSSDEQNTKTRYLKMIVDKPGGVFNEITVYESGSTQPLRGIKVIEQSTDKNDRGTIANLFDEPNKTKYTLSFLTEAEQDETIHVRTASELLNHREPYEKTHPYLGHLLIGLGISIFGMNPFGWRIISLIFGAAMISILCVFGMKLFRRRFWAFSAAFLMMFDFLHFVQTRIGTIDIFAVTFISLMYYFMYEYYRTKANSIQNSKSALGLLGLSGLFFSLGAATKWYTIYGALGLAIIFLMAHYQASKNNHNKHKTLSWIKDLLLLKGERTLLYCLLFFIIAPLAIYLLSYVPFMLIPGPGHDFQAVIQRQFDMYHIQSQPLYINEDASRWWSWPLIFKPCRYFEGINFGTEKISRIYAMGNPVIWWAGIIAVLASLFIAFRKRDQRILVILIAFAGQFLPWALVSRSTFLYHFFSALPFLILLIGYLFEYLVEQKPQAIYGVYAYLGAVLLAFILFYPILSGISIDKSYIEHYLIWFKSWKFI